MIPVPRTKKNITRHELIGLDTELPEKNIKGTIIDETMKTLTIRTAKKDITTIKTENTYNIILDDGTAADVDGKILYGRPEDRIKKKIKSKWKPRV